ncbi:MAG: folate-binding protein [Gammaproteobacteria bacterium]|nr:MAG: folate-binding protein [Gammaproteobacteria bacterium]
MPTAREKMNDATPVPDTWCAHLESSGMRTDDDEKIHFGDPRAEIQSALSGTVEADLSWLAPIQVQGEDAETFLQGQFTCDVNSISVDGARFGAWCDLKGRVTTLVRLIRTADGFWMLVPQALKTNLLSRLRLAVMRSDVQITDASNNNVCVGIAGSNAHSLLEGSLGFAPREQDAAAASKGLVIDCLPDDHPRFILIGPSERMIELWLALAKHAQPAGHEAWDLLDVLSGIPWIRASTSGEFLPQMIGLKRLSAVSFTKGCYLGQEVVTRVEHIGKVKRRLHLLHAPTASTVEIGASIFSGSESEQAVGVIVGSARHPGGGWRMLAVLTDSALERGEFALGNEERSPVCVLEKNFYPPESAENV